MSTILSPLSRPGTALALLALTALGALPAASQTPSLAPLEDRQPLPEPPGAFGYTSPGVAVRPDGGMIALWRDAMGGDVLGRWFGPVAPDGESEGGVFLLEEAEPSLALAPLVVRGAGDRYLGLWLELRAAGLFLVDRPFDGEGRPLGPSRDVAHVDTVRFDLAARPGGGYAVVYQELPEDGGGVRLLLLGANGAPTATSVRVLEDSQTEPVSIVNVAVDDAGTIAVTWSRLHLAAGGTADIGGRTFDAAAQPLGPAFPLVPEESSFGGLEHDLAATGNGHFLVAWVGNRLTLGHPPRSVYALAFEASGFVILQSRIDAGGSPDGAASFPVVSAAPDGPAVIAWADEDHGILRPVARLVAPSSAPRGPVVVLDTPPKDFYLVNGMAVDRGADGVIAFGWGYGIITPFIPTTADSFRESLARRYQADFDCYPVERLGFRTEPAAPTADDPVTLVFDLAGVCVDFEDVVSSREDDTFSVDLTLHRAVCDPPFFNEVTGEVEVGTLAAGSYQVALSVSDDERPACSPTFGFSVAPGAPPPPPPPPPDVPPLTTEKLPGFRVWVLIGSPSMALVAGAREPRCVPETLCISGRVAGRSEVFVRIPGPKPNGLLWPTLVKLTTSEVQVWIEQVATGEVRYYRLEGARPGFDELPGLFDRHGFEP